MKKSLLVLLMGCFALTACVQDGKQNEQIGTLLGAAGGAVVGSQFGKGSGQIVGTAVGTLLGAYAGGHIGQKLDETDRLYANQAAQDSFEYGKMHQTTTWQNPDTGHGGSVTPVKTYKAPDGTYCREFTQSVTIDGKSEQAQGTACRQADGTWKII